MLFCVVVGVVGNNHNKNNNHNHKTNFLGCDSIEIDLVGTISWPLNIKLTPNSREFTKEDWSLTISFLPMVVMVMVNYTEYCCVNRETNYLCLSYYSSHDLIGGSCHHFYSGKIYHTFCIHHVETADQAIQWKKGNIYCTYLNADS